MPVTYQTFQHEVLVQGLVSKRDWQAALKKLPPNAHQNVEQITRELVRLGALTAYQAEAIDLGKGAGLIIGPYVVLDQIGAGGMGVVFKAQRRGTKGMVALKVLPPGSSKAKDKVDRFAREVRAVGKLRHANIVAAYDSGVDDDVHYLVMEYVPGTSLSHKIKTGGRLPVRDAVQYTWQVACGLDHAHQQGIVHRDIKPGNLLLTPDETVKILDMGLARFDAAEDAAGEAPSGDSLTNTGQILGTVDYMAPEQAVNTKRADHRSDVYSLGCTMYWMLTADYLFHGETIMERLLAHREDPVPALRDARPEVSEKLERVFQKMVAKRAEERYQSMQHVISDLAECLAELAPPAEAGAEAEAAPLMPPTRVPPPSESYVETSQAHTSAETLDNRWEQLEPDPGSVGSGSISEEIVAAVRRSPAVWGGIGGAVLLLLFACLVMILLMQTPRGTVQLTINEPGASVLLDGDQLAESPASGGLELSIKAGSHELVVEKPGFQTFRTQIAVEADGTAVVEVRLLKQSGIQPPPAQLGSAGEVDVLAMLDPARDAYIGNWQRLGEGIFSNRAYAKLLLPYLPPDEYQVTAVVEPISAQRGMVLGMIAGDETFLVVIDGWGGNISGLDAVDGRPSNNNPTTRRNKLLAAGQPTRIECTVRADAIQVTVDGNSLIDFRRDGKRLSLRTLVWQTPQPRLFFGTESPIKLTQYTLKPLSDGGTAVDLSPPETLGTLEIPPPRVALHASREQLAGRPIPDADTFAKVSKQVRSLFQNDFAAAKTPEAHARLAEQLLAVAQQEPNPTNRYAWYRAALDEAAAAGSAGLVTESLTPLREYAVNVDDLGLAALRKLDTADPLARANLAWDLSGRLARRGQLAEAQEAAGLGSSAAAQTADTGLKTQYLKLQKTLQRQVFLYQAARQAAAQYEQGDIDPQAHLQLGLYLVAAERRFPAGLRHLAAGSDQTIANLARRDLQRPTRAADQVKLGDTWWRVATLRETWQQAALLDRAATWYRLALPRLSGADRTRADERLKQLGDSQPARSALVFGGSQFAVVPQFKYNGSHPLTVEATVVAWANSYQSLVANYDSSGFGLNIEREHWRFAFHDGTRYQFAISDLPAAMADSTHIAGVYDQKQVRLYVNGKLQAATAVVSKHRSSPYPLMMGADPRHNTYPQRWFHGQIDEVRISKVARYTADYVPAARLTADADTLLLYHFDEGAGPRADSDTDGPAAQLFNVGWGPEN